MQRIVRLELLDELPPDDPRAIRSRSDLRKINTVMGNPRWIENTVSSLDCDKITELGSGEGVLTQRLGQHGWVNALDLAPPPEGLPKSVTWLEGDLFDTLPQVDGKVLVACLILHHFEDDQIRQLAEMAKNYDSLVFCEPWRTRWSHGVGSLGRPLMNDVTWHDMHVSIDAGFLPGEIPKLFGDVWGWDESTTFFGALRTVGRKR